MRYISVLEGQLKLQKRFHKGQCANFELAISASHGSSLNRLVNDVDDGRSDQF